MIAITSFFKYIEQFRKMTDQQTKFIRIKDCISDCAYMIHNRDYN